MTVSARDIAVDALRDRQGNVSARLETLLDKHNPPAVERGFARELALGVVRRRGTITQILRAFLKQPKRPVPPVVKQALHVAIYQLVFLDRVPSFAAVDEAVGQVRRFRHPHYANMVNAVLRGVERSMGEMATGKAPLDSRAIPIDPTRHLWMDRAILPDPAQDLPAYIAGAFSLPPALAVRWLKQFGNAARVADLGYHANARAPLIARVDTARIAVPEVLAQLEADGIAARPHANGVSVVFDAFLDVPALPQFQQGLLTPQDATPTAVGEQTQVRPGMEVLDFCAAPGTKTVQMAQQMAGQGRIVAVDVADEKLAMIRASCDRLGIDTVQTILARDIGQLSPMSFDVVLLDVPCSNTGVLARRPEARWRFIEADFRRLVRDQRLLMQAAAAFVKPGGRLVYATCSIEGEENDQAAEWASRHVPTLSLKAKQKTLPAGATDATHWRDGGFWAVFG